MINRIKIYQDFDPAFVAEPNFTLPIDALAKIKGRPYVEITNPFPAIQLDPGQKSALDEIVYWVIHPNPTDRILTVGGLAGSGKSTILNYLQAYLRQILLPHAFTSITGKAVLTLKSKGIYSARTVHSLLYHVDEDAKRDGHLKFIKNHWVHEYVIIVDEGQTLPEKSISDFMSFPHVRVILVGDHGQLEPIGGSSDFMKNPRIRLEEVHRQALTSDILKVAHSIRQGKMPTFGESRDVKIAPKALFEKELENPDLGQVIVGFNKTRHKVNEKIRKIRKFSGKYPQVGELVISLTNNEYLGIYNGQIFEVLESEPFLKDEILRMELESDGQRYSVKALAEQFGTNKLDYSFGQKYYLRGISNVCFLDYSYAISCHKALGSQWDRGAILEELHPEWSRQRWCYSAMTRFIKYFSFFR